MLSDSVLSVRLLINSRLSVVKFLGSQKLYGIFNWLGVTTELTPGLLKGQGCLFLCLIYQLFNDCC